MAEEIKGLNKEVAEKLLAAKSREERLNIVAEAGLELSDEDMEKIAGGLIFARNTGSEEDPAPKPNPMLFTIPY